jgi:outer membrane protein OmpA-like peptidoglycan-associated protein
MYYLYKKIVVFVVFLAIILSVSIHSSADSFDLSNFLNLNSNLDLVFSKIKKAGSDEEKNIARSIWAQGYFSHANQISPTLIDIGSQRKGFQAGFNLATSKTAILGIYGGYNLNSFSGSKDDNITEYEIGVYRGTYGEFTNVKFIMAYASDNIDFRILPNLRTHNGKLGFDIEFLFPISQSIDIRIFGQGQGIAAYNEKKRIDSNDVILPGISYRAQTVAGLRLIDDKSDFNWNIAVFAGYLFIGRVETDNLNVNVSTSTPVENPFKMQASQKFIFGYSVGLEYIVSNIVSLYALAGFRVMEFKELYSGGGENYLGGGVRFLFGGKKGEKKADVTPAIATQTAQILGEAKVEKLINAEEDVEKVEVSSKDNDFFNYSQLSSSPDGNAQAAIIENTRIKEDISLMELESENEDLALKKAQADKKKYSNLIKSFILSVAVFKSGGYELTPEAKKEIKVLTDNIKKYHYSKITIEGHSDSSGNPITNQKLSVLRARSVFGELFLNGVPLEKMEYLGVGAAMPISSNKTVDGRARNRRVEIFVE